MIKCKFISFPFLTFAIMVIVTLVTISCRKKDNPAIPTVKYTYTNSRLKEIDKSGAKIQEFIYDDKNKLLTYKMYNQNANPGTIVVSSADYEYDANDKLIKKTWVNSSNSNIKAITDYIY
jgi:hypothetical protein